MFDSNQQDMYGRYYDRACEFGGHGGDAPVRGYEDLPAKPSGPVPWDKLSQYSRDLWPKDIPYPGHDREPCPPNCCCPTCIIASVRDEM